MKDQLINRPKGTDGKAILGSDNTTALNQLEKVSLNDLDKDKIGDLAECLFVLNNKKYGPIPGAYIDVYKTRKRVVCGTIKCR